MIPRGLHFEGALLRALLGLCFLSSPVLAAVQEEDTDEDTPAPTTEAVESTAEEPVADEPGPAAVSLETRFAAALHLAAAVEAPVGTLGRRVAGLGAEAAPLVVEVLATGIWTDTVAQPPRDVVLEEDHRRELFLAAALLGRDAVIPYLAPRVTVEEPTMRVQILVLRLLGKIGTGADFGLVLASAVPTGDERYVEARVQSALLEAAAAILERDPDGLEALDRVSSKATDEQLGYLVRSVGDLGTREGLEWIVSRLGSQSGVVVPALSQVTRVAAPLSDHDDTIRAPVRAWLAVDDFQILREACSAVAALSDWEAVPLLIEVLDREELVLREAAYRSLVSITGLSMRRDAETWERWYEAELSWFQQDAPALFHDLEHPHERQVLRALRELQGHRFDRSSMALEIAGCLDHPSAEVRRSACAALRVLGVRAGTRELVACLEDEDESVSTEAWQALAAITGEELPNDAFAWQDWAEEALPE